MSIKKNALTAGLAAALLIGSTAASFAVSAMATGDVNVRRGPGTGYGIVDQLYDGESVDVRGCNGGWCQIVHSGPDGWVSANYLTRDRGDDFVDHNDVGVDFFVGNPYRHHRPYYQPRFHRHSSVCFGGNNAQFCFAD